MTIEGVTSHSRAHMKHRMGRGIEGRGEVSFDMINLLYLLGFVYVAFGYCLCRRIWDRKEKGKHDYTIHV